MYTFSRIIRSSLVSRVESLPQVKAWSVLVHFETYAGCADWIASHDTVLLNYRMSIITAGELPRLLRRLRWPQQHARGFRGQQRGGGRVAVDVQAWPWARSRESSHGGLRQQGKEPFHNYSAYVMSLRTLSNVRTVGILAWRPNDPYIFGQGKRCSIQNMYQVCCFLSCRGRVNKGKTETRRFYSLTYFARLPKLSTPLHRKDMHHIGS